VWNLLETSEAHQFYYAVNQDNHDFMQSVHLTGIFDIRGQCGQLSKYYDGSKNRKNIFGVTAESLYIGNPGSFFCGSRGRLGTVVLKFVFKRLIGNSCFLKVNRIHLLI